MAKIIKLLIRIITVILMAYAPITTSIDFKFNNQIIHDSYNQTEQHIVVNNGPVYINQYYFKEDKKTE